VARFFAPLAAVPSSDLGLFVVFRTGNCNLYVR
jgi:hypothetical protein